MNGLTHRRPPALATLAAALALGALGAASARAAEPVLAVLYVDNHSGDARWDVARKGLADMLVTDLAAQGLTVVERTRLQALLDEQALQASSFVDPKTAVRVGQGLGATHVVTGALAAVSPDVRLDLRMVSVATGEVAVTASARGPATSLFDLEQQLVERFVAAFDRKLRAVPLPTTKVKDAETLFDYSRALDLADCGELDAAKQALDAAVKRSPAFGLARLRRDELVQRLAAVREKRDDVIGGERQALAAATIRALAGRATTPEERLARLTWRGVQGRFLGMAIAALLSDKSFGVAALGQEKALPKALVAWADNQLLFVKELDDLKASAPDFRIRFELGAEDARRAQAAGIDLDFPDEPAEARRELARFLWQGELDLGRGGRVTVAPPLAVLDAAWDKRATALVDEAERLGHAKAAVRAEDDRDAFEAIELRAEALLLRGKTEDAVATWQAALERYPTSSAFDRVDRRIQQVLGLEHEHTTAAQASWAKGLAECADMPLRVGLDVVVYRRMRLAGLRALDDLVAEVERGCPDRAPLKMFWPYLYKEAALQYGRHGRCPEFERWMQKALAAGESRSDVEGYRKNWTACPQP